MGEAIPQGGDKVGKIRELFPSLPLKKMAELNLVILLAFLAVFGP